MARFNLDSYVDVQERVGTFWIDHPDGAIITGMVSLPDEFEQVVFRAEVYKHRDDARPSATGYAAETAGKSMSDGANYTSWHENAETSAIGRALANLGMAKSRTDRPSRQEMAKVNRATAAPQRPPNAPRPQPPPVSGGNDRTVDTSTGEILDADDRQQRADDRTATTPGGASVRSLNYSLVLADEAGVSADEAHRWCGDQFGRVSRNDLDQRQMSRLIDWLQERKAAVVEAPPASDSADLDHDDAGNIISWTKFWAECRALGVKSPADFEAKVGAKQTAYTTPAAALAALKGTEG